MRFALVAAICSDTGPALIVLPSYESGHYKGVLLKCRPSIHELFQAKTLCFPRQRLSLLIIFFGFSAIYFFFSGGISSFINDRDCTLVIRVPSHK